MQVKRLCMQSILLKEYQSKGELRRWRMSICGGARAAWGLDLVVDSHFAVCTFLRQEQLKLLGSHRGEFECLQFQANYKKILGTNSAKIFIFTPYKFNSMAQAISLDEDPMAEIFIRTPHYLATVPSTLWTSWKSRGWLQWQPWNGCIYSPGFMYRHSI